jgi:putative NIF3 family GTP cyclohydrolase 1 type 2
MAEQPPPQRNAQPDFRTLPPHTGPITALQFISRILDKTGAPNRDKTIDHVAAGDPTTAVTGIATMALASMDGLKRAAAAGRNLILSYDPPFWSGNDDLDRIEGNSLFLEKRDFIRAHNLVCFNLHDHWRDRAPDGVAVGMAKALGWTQYQAEAANPALLHLPPTNLETLARDLQSRLDDPTIRVVGDPKLEVRKVAAIWGTANQMPAIKLLNTPVDVVITGYAREWEAVEYAQDMIATGQKKGLILLGEVASVDLGMKYCAEWISSFITEVPVEFISGGKTYWSVG